MSALSSFVRNYTCFVARKAYFFIFFYLCYELRTGLFQECACVDCPSLHTSGHFFIFFFFFLSFVIFSFTAKTALRPSITIAIKMLSKGKIIQNKHETNSIKVPTQNVLKTCSFCFKISGGVCIVNCFEGIASNGLSISWFQKYGIGI